MKKNYPYLKDVSFLKEVTKSHIQTYYVKINILNWEEYLVESIEGRVTTGNINIDGKSSIRRTLSLNFYVDGLINDITNPQNLLSINKKIQVEIGLKNRFNKYTDYSTLWFPQGIYIISSCNISNDANGANISLQAKDKMCLLNGECGGTFPATTQLDVYNTISSDGEDITLRPTIYQIIQELVNHFGGQQLGKIIISDVDPLVKNVVRWMGDSPLYKLSATGTNGFSGQYIYTTDFSVVQLYKRQKWNVTAYSYDQDIGYVYSDFTWPAPQNSEEVSNFVCDAGSTVTDALDKIINQVLGNYEYFYDVNGNFIFRQIKNYLNNAQSKFISEYKNREANDLYNQFLLPDYINHENYSPYLFEIDKGTSAISLADDNDIITSYNNSPQYNSIKNDIIVWGNRKGIDGKLLPLRYHLVIDEKPPITYIDSNDVQQPVTYRAFKLEENGQETWYTTLFQTSQVLPDPGVANLYYEIYDLDTNGEKQTVSKKYKGNYITIQEGNNEINYKTLVKTWNSKTRKYVTVDAKVKEITAKDWRTVLFFQGVMAELRGTDSNYYYAELKVEWPKIYDIEKGEFRERTILHPSEINYYLDFIDADSYLTQLSVKNIGRRTKVFNQKNNVNCVFEPNIEDIIFIRREDITQATNKEGWHQYESDIAKYIEQEKNKDKTTGEGSDSSQQIPYPVSSLTFENNTQRILDYCLQYGQPYYKIESEIYDNFALGGFANSAYQTVRQQIQELVSYHESVTVQCLPMYFLEPNERITLYNKDSNVFGDYMINSMSFSFDVSSTLTINASRVVTKI